MRERLRSRDTESLYVPIAAFLAAGVFFFVSLWSLPPAVEATSHQAWEIYPGIDENDVTEYGWHFDESHTAFGARDFNHPDDDDDLTVWLRLEVKQNLPFLMRYTKDSYDGGCGIQSELQAFSGSWITISSTELRYLHITDVVTGTTVAFQAVQSGAFSFVGTIAHSGNGSGCMDGLPHLHQSARLGFGFTEARVHDDDTCWIDNADDSGQCEDIGDNDNYTRAHDDCPFDFVTGGAPYDKSGNISEYICQEWSLEDHDEDVYVFDVPSF